MEPTNERLLERIDRYIEDLFLGDDALSPALAASLQDSNEAGLPPIQVSPNQGKLLYLLARLARAERILEIGTLGGYSAIWLARALPPHGRLISLEIEGAHAAVARTNVERAGVGDLVEIQVGPARESLRGMLAQGVAPFDLIFIDADKISYPEYLQLSLPLSHSGTLILADNVIRGGGVLDEAPADATDRGAKAYNETIAQHSRLESLILPILRARVDGLAISLVK